jgi:hypothetical protein
MDPRGKIIIDQIVLRIRIRCLFFTPRSGKRQGNVGKLSDPGSGLEKSRIWIRNTNWKKIRCQISLTVPIGHYR